MQRNEVAFVPYFDIGAIFQQVLGYFDVIVTGGAMQRGGMSTRSVRTVHIGRRQQALDSGQVAFFASLQQGRVPAHYINQILVFHVVGDIQRRLSVPVLEVDVGSVLEKERWMDS